jgi:hypothetical protein
MSSRASFPVWRAEAHSKQRKSAQREFGGIKILGADFRDFSHQLRGRFVSGSGGVVGFETAYARLCPRRWGDTMERACGERSIRLGAQWFGVEGLGG